MKLIFRFGITAMLFIMVLGFSSNLKAQYCEASIDTKSGSEAITGVKFNTIDNQNNGESLTIQDWTSISTNVNAGSSYDIKLTLNANSYDGDMAYVWIDFNNDYKYSTDDEEYHLDPYVSKDRSISGTITIPSNAVPGTYRMRIRMIDFKNNTYGHTYPKPCDATTFGETEEYTIIVSSGFDAGIVDIINPVSPFIVGNYNVIMKIKNNGANTLNSAKIDWSINKVNQTPVYWTGSLSTGQTTTLSMGLYNFNYPPTGPFDPFAISASISNLNNQSYDDDPSNNQLDKTLSPVLNDCGAIGFFGPPEGFGAGVTQVKARIKNYSPKPLTKITVNWSMDGTTQPPVTFTSLDLKNGETIDLDVGTFMFYNKTPLAPFNVECWTSMPNGVNDEDKTNDKYVGGIGPSLSAGTFKIGGSNAHFPSIVNAASYLNSGGVFGSGTVYFDVRPGTYTGQIILNNKLPNGNTIIFRSESGRNSDVIIDAKPAAANNFIVQINGMNNVQFRDMTISNNNSNISFAGRVFDISNVSNIMIHNCLINGVANSPKDAAYSSIVLNNAGIEIMKSIFNSGSIGVDVQNTGTLPISVSDNTFSNFSVSGIKVLNNGSTYNSISNNNFKIEGTGIYNNGIWIEGPVNVTGNVFSGLRGTGDVNEGVIKIMQTYPTQALMVSIIGNSINNCSNINGLKIDNAYAFVNRNYFNISQTLNNSNAIIYFTNTQGYVGNNILVGSNVYGIQAHNLNNLNILYNSISLNSGSEAIIHSVSADINVMRNIFSNKGTGMVYEISGGKQVYKENTFYSAAAIFATVNGTSYSSLETWLAAGFDTGSRISDVTFKSSTDLQIGLYNPSILYNTPLFSNDNGLAGIIETADFNGKPRNYYFAGSDEIYLFITLARQSNGFIDCEGSATNSLTVSTIINYGAEMTYQWSKDGVDIVGQTEPVLYFKNLLFAQSGLYKCKIGGPGITVPIYSEPVTVYVATPTIITEPPQNVIQPFGTVATFTFDAHVNGKKIADAIINDEVKVQWFKYESDTKSTLLTDAMPRISGSKSNYLTIKNFTKADLGKYYAQVIGLCGTVKTINAELIEETLDITILNQPATLTICEGTDAVFSIDASTPTSRTIKYQWYNGTTAIKNVNGSIDGATGRQLSIFDAKSIDAGEYYCVVSLEGTSLMKQSDKVQFNVKVKPEILTQPLGVTLKDGEDLSLEVTVADINDPSVKYQWYKDNRPLLNAATSKYTKSKVSLGDATSGDQGSYWCVITNDCGKITSDKVDVVITTGTTSVTDVQSNGYTLSVPVPNPVNSIANVSYYVPSTTNVKITLCDVQGTFENVLVNQLTNAGENNLTINASQMNISSGSYFIKLESNGIVLVKKVVVVK